MEFGVNNERQIEVKQDKSDGDVSVTTWGAPNEDGCRDCESEYSISPGDFVIMLNWYKYQKQHGNESLNF